MMTGSCTNLVNGWSAGSLGRCFEKCVEVFAMRDEEDGGRKSFSSTEINAALQ